MSRKKKRTGVVKAKVPIELLNRTKDLEKKMGLKAEWDKEETLEENYRKNGCVPTAPVAPNSRETRHTPPREHQIYPTLNLPAASSRI